MLKHVLLTMYPKPQSKTARMFRSLLCIGLGVTLSLNSGCDAINSDVTSDSSTVSDNDDSNNVNDESPSIDATPNTNKSTDSDRPVKTDLTANAKLSDGVSVQTTVLSLPTETVASVNDNVKQVISQVFTAQNDRCRHLQPNKLLQMRPEGANIGEETLNLDPMALRLQSGRRVDNDTDIPNSVATSSANNAGNNVISNEIQGCQYAKIQALSFESQAWLNDIVWRNIAAIIQPQLLLADLDDMTNVRTAEHSKPLDMQYKTQEIVMRMLEDIEQSSKSTTRFPLTQLLVMEFFPNEVSLSQHETAYFKFRSLRKDYDVLPELYYEQVVMIDMTTKKPLQLTDVLLDTHTSSELLAILQQTHKQWSVASYVKNTETDWPLHLAQQWYLTDDGLHLLYQPGEMISGTLPVIDDYNKYLVEMVVPTPVINGLLKSEYMLNSVPATALNSQGQLASPISDLPLEAGIQVNLLPIDISEVTQPLIASNSAGF